MTDLDLQHGVADTSSPWQLRPQRSRSIQEEPSYVFDESSDEMDLSDHARRPARRPKRRKRGDRHLPHVSRRAVFGANSIMAACAWCGKVENKKKLKRGVTSVVGRPRECWTKAGLPLLYTCCCCYEERRKGRMLDHKKELLKAQYRAFDEFGVEFYEMRKKIDDMWMEWTANSDEVWFELAHAYYMLKSFDSIKASPITDPVEIAHVRASQQRERKGSVSSCSSISSAATSVFGCAVGHAPVVAEKVNETVSVFMAAEILMDMSGEGSC